MVNTRKLKGEKTPTTEEEDRDTNLAAANENINAMDSVEEGEEDENYVDTRDLTELRELDNAREEEMGELIALDMRVTALEEKAVDENNKIVDAKNKMEALDILLASLEAYVDEEGDDSPEDSPEDVKERE
ncbi:hypothetical protein Bca4012_051050 [Brassica carinata]|uniref:Uncharacterized protein n=2 Tax=Brassica TaxID=3705 RepID=A0A8X7R733_BRACI|nr:hypothetical protein Bca52824_053727 [Brassica carinata]VDD24290.1 unnamed protein product [Brassica oleracea]